MINSGLTLSNDRLRRIPHFMFAAIGLLTTLHLAAVLLRFALGVPQAKGFVPLFYFDLEGNAPTWYSATAWIIAGLLATGLGLKELDSRGGRHRSWFIIAALCALLSLDEIAGIHEMPIDYLREQWHFTGLLYYGWVIFGLAFVALVAAALGNFVFQLSTETRGRIAIAGGVFLAGAIGIEMLSGWQATRAGEENLTYALIITVEEFCEMLGVTLFARALCAELCGQSVRARCASGANASVAATTH